MYEVDQHDRVIELKSVPQSSVGAPIPVLLAGEHDVLLAYYLQDAPAGWDGATVRVVDADSEGEPVAVVKFRRCYAHMFGPPNDEAFSGHPLSARGLRPYAVFEVRESSWLRRLEEMNSVHPYHNRTRFMENKRHFVFSFHDTTFECIADGFEIEVTNGSVKSMVPRMLESLT
jgi:hypothetical protein